MLVNEDFNTLLSDKDERVIRFFGEHVEQRRYYAVNEASIQAIGGGDVTWIFFAHSLWISANCNLRRQV